MKTLFDKTMLAGLPMKNRLVRSATGDCLATKEGYITAAIFDLYEELAVGGVALIILGYTAVTEVDPFSQGMLRLSNDTLVPEYARLAACIHNHGAHVMPQLALGTYQRRVEDDELVTLGVNDMTNGDIATVVQCFIDAARRAKEAGFDGVQLHGCHKVLLSEFLRPKRNHRIDAYVGSVIGRTRIVVEIIRSIHEILGDFHVSIKLNNTDIPLDECVETCKILEQAGLDSLEMEWLYPQLHEARRECLKVPIILTGEHRGPESMEQLMGEEGIEYFGLSRPLIREPDLPKRWQSGWREEANCTSCDRCLLQPPRGCVYRPRS